MTEEREKKFMFVIRRALLMIVRGIESGEELGPLTRRALLMVTGWIDEEYGIAP